MRLISAVDADIGGEIDGVTQENRAGIAWAVGSALISVSVVRKACCQGFHVLVLGIHARMLGFGATSAGAHFIGHPVESALIALAVRAAPYDPVTLPMAGALVGIFLRLTLYLEIVHC